MKIIYFCFIKKFIIFVHSKVYRRDARVVFHKGMRPLLFATCLILLIYLLNPFYYLFSTSIYKRTYYSELQMTFSLRNMCQMVMYGNRIQRISFPFRYSRIIEATLLSINNYYNKNEVCSLIKVD